MGPMNAGLPALPPGMRWKSKLISTSSVFDPSVEAPLAYGYFRVVWGGAGAGAINTTYGGVAGNIFDTIGVIEITGPVTVTPGAGGAGGSSGGAGGDTTLSWTNADGTAQVLFAKGALADTRCYPMNASFNAPDVAGGNPYVSSWKMPGMDGRVNCFPVLMRIDAVTGGEGGAAYFAYTGGYVCSSNGSSANSAWGQAGWRGRGGRSSPGSDPGVGFSSGGGTNGSSTGGAGKGGFAEFFWMEPV